jgi:hypothetical protein
MDDSDTFKRLKRIPLQDMIQLYEAAQHSLSPLYTVAQTTFETYARRLRSLEVHRMRNKILEDGGWTVDELFAAIEKEAIIDEVAKLNASIELPKDIIDRAKAIFPDMVFHQARIEI